ncbi:MAG TPA: competence/damage-inducible protein A [Candidatus Baltobacteraceae bacterium]|nr:competence/damage-inducible protein A [Candidatus Baltobacteraceae bacterium]
MPSVEILAVGTELLLGQLVDTNTAHVAGTLAQCGIDVYATHAVGDNRERIAAAMRAALDRADGVITTGGLGPTVDDLTKEAACDVLGTGTELHEQSLRTMEERFRRIGRVMQENNRKQADVPRGSVVMANANGTAPGFIAVRPDGKFIACMPGVPAEMKPMLADQLLPWLRERLHATQAIYTRVLHTIDIAESEIDFRIDDLFRTLENPKIAVLASDYRCNVKIMAKAPSAQQAQTLIAPVQAQLEQRLRGHVYALDDQTLAGAIHELLQRESRTIASAESCTGGSIAAEFTSVPGSSKSFIGGVVAYDNSIKRSALGVRAATLDRCGAVSEETVIEMAQGVRTHLHADVGIATTGIAGPTGGSAEKPVGLVWLGIADGGGVRTQRLELAGERAVVQRRATVAALGFLWRLLRR